jgi:hypothetical protein
MAVVYVGTLPTILVGQEISSWRTVLHDMEGSIPSLHDHEKKGFRTERDDPPMLTLGRFG